MVFVLASIHSLDSLVTLVTLVKGTVEFRVVPICRPRQVDILLVVVGCRKNCVSRVRTWNFDNTFQINATFIVQWERWSTHASFRQFGADLVGKAVFEDWLASSLLLSHRLLLAHLRPIKQPRRQFWPIRAPHKLGYCWCRTFLLFHHLILRICEWVCYRAGPCWQLKCLVLILGRKVELLGSQFWLGLVELGHDLLHSVLPLTHLIQQDRVDLFRRTLYKLL